MTRPPCKLLLLDTLQQLKDVVFVLGRVVISCFCSQDPNFWTYRPLSELMVRAAADDVRFLLFIYHKMLEKLNERSLWYLAVRGALYCRCFCISDNNFADWPALPPVPGIYFPVPWKFLSSSSLKQLLDRWLSMLMSTRICYN